MTTDDTIQWEEVIEDFTGIETEPENLDDQSEEIIPHDQITSDNSTVVADNTTPIAPNP
jgi:hypothetical protein